MGFVEKNLMPNEKIIARTKHHWWVFVGPAFWILIGTIFISAPLWIQDKELHPLMILVGMGVVFVGVFFLVGSLIAYFTSEYAITNKKVVMKIGFIRRVTLEAFLGKVEGFSVEQSILGRIFNFGTIVISTGGVSQPFAMITAPMEFRKRVQEEISKAQSS